MNAFSFQEDEEPSQLHSLQQEIGSEYIDTWIGKSQKRLEDDCEYEPNVLSQFDMNIPSQGDIPPSANHNKETCDQACEVLNQPEADPSTSSQQRVEEVAEIQATQTSSQGQTFYEQTNVSTTVVQGSVIQQNWKKESGKALNEFVLISESIYSPLILTFKKILKDTKAYSDKTMENLNMYYLFFSIKLSQQKQRSSILQAKKATLESKLKQSLLLDSVYLDQRVVIQQMLDKDEKRRQILNIFCEKVEDSCEKIKMLRTKALEFRTKKIDHIVAYIQRTQRIQKELIDLMVKPSSEKDQSRWAGKPDMRCDRYLQRKYLQERERLFLSQLKATGEKIIALMHSIFIKEEPVICAILGKQMERYYKLNQELYGMLRPFSEQTRVESKKVQEELKEVLRSIVPSQWMQSGSNNQDSSVEDIINQLYAYLQDQIFLPTVVIEPELILFQQKGKWITKAGEVSPQKEKSKRNFKVKGKQNQQENPVQGANQPTCAAQRDMKDLKEVFNRVKGMEVMIVLTADKYLHLECGEKIACLKLKRLKMNRKSDRKIILNERRGSITNIFAASPYLGELILQSEQAADAFIGAVLSTQA